jgi:hypothetical protein
MCINAILLVPETVAENSICMAILLIQSFGMSRQIISVHSATHMISISNFKIACSGMLGVHKFRCPVS